MSVACVIDGLFQGALYVTPDTARHLVEKGIIKATKVLGRFRLVDDKEDTLWHELRKRAW